MAKNEKELTKGDTGLYSISLFDQDGDAYVPSVGESLMFYLLKKDCDDLSEAILTKSIDINTMQLELLPTDTADLSTGSYPYKIRLTDTNGREWTVVKSKLKLIC